MDDVYEEIEFAQEFGPPKVETRGRKPKQSWDPCADCGQPDGPIPQKSRTPARLSLVRFGVNGKGCLTCYNRRFRQHTRKKPGVEIATVPSDEC